jgi:DNA-binding MarR family transcriptional regulator
MNPDNKHPVPRLIIFEIGALHSNLLRVCNKIFRDKEFLLEMDQIPVLMVLYYEGGASQQRICSALQRNKASVNRTVSFLLKIDLVIVKQDPTDKRKTWVELTKTGKKLAADAHATLEKYNASLSSALTKEENNQFHNLMSKLISATTSA